MSEQALVLNVRGGARIALPPDLAKITTYIALEQEDWFEDEIRFVRAWLRPGMRALDIGANFGLYTLSMGGAVGPAGRVVAFEPAPPPAEYLERSLQLNAFAHVALARVAVSAERGTAAFELGAQSELAALAASDGAGLRVPTAPLDELVEEHGIPDPDFVKMDVEGHELHVVEGGERFFRRASPLVMLEVLARDQVDLAALRRLEALGYRAYRLLPGPLVLEPWSSDLPAEKFMLNLFACKPDRAAALAEAGRLSSAGEGMGRVAELRAAMARCEEALRARVSLALLMTQARLAWELGARGRAVATLLQAIQAFRPESPPALDDAFLAPLPMFDARPADAGTDWIACALVESFERLRHYSSVFASASLPVLEAIRDLPFATPQIERRLQLMAIAAGRQQGPRPAEKLRAVSDENLNPAFWCPGSGGR